MFLRNGERRLFLSFDLADARMPSICTEKTFMCFTLAAHDSVEFLLSSIVSRTGVQFGTF